MSISTDQIIRASSNLKFKAGDVFTLSTADWAFKFPPGKSKAAYTGMAFDGRIKKHLGTLGLDIAVPLDQYAPYDFVYDDIYWDIKTHTRGSVSISDREIEFGNKKILKGSAMLYLVFAQIEGVDDLHPAAAFQGVWSLKTLQNCDKIKDSQYSGVYFSVKDSAVRRLMVNWSEE